LINVSIKNIESYKLNYQTLENCTIILNNIVDTSFCSPYDLSLYSPMMITLGRSRIGLGPGQRNSLVGCFWMKEKPYRNPKGAYAALTMHTHP